MTYFVLHSLLLSHEFVHGHTLSSLTISPLTYTDQHVAHLFNDLTSPMIALKIIPPIIVVVEETLEEEVVVSHPLGIIRMVNLDNRLLTTKLVAKYVMAPIT